MTPRNEKLIDKALPSSEEAERCIIGGVLMDTKMMATAAETLEAADFYSPLNRRIFAAMLELFSSHQKIDPIFIYEALAREGEVASIDGPQTITSLSFGLPFFTDLSPYIEIVRQKKQVRELVKACDQMGAMARAEDEPASVILERAQTTINEVCTANEKQAFSTVGEISFAQIEKMKQLRDGTIQATGLKADITSLDIVTGGFQPSDLIVIGGRPSMGKSSLAGQIAMNACQKEPSAVVVIFSLEMSKEQYVQRLICSRAQVDIMKFRQGALNPYEVERAERADAELNAMHLHIDDSSSTNAVQMRSKLLQIRHKKGRLDAVMVDFLQRMTTARKTEGRQQEVSRIAQDLKSLAKDMNVPVIALSSLSRECEKRQPPRPRMSDLRESGDIESEADLVAFLYRPNYYNDAEDPMLAELIIEKHRNGPTKTVKLHFLREYTRFSNYG